jgi:hypothetical protein
VEQQVREEKVLQLWLFQHAQFSTFPAALQPSLGTVSHQPPLHNAFSAPLEILRKFQGTSASYCHIFLQLLSVQLPISSGALSDSEPASSEPAF